MQFGVDYYPEHWEEERWPIDLDLMKEAKFDTLRIAEFAWSRMEPSVGRYDFEWLDRFLALASARGLGVMMGVPARNVPAWLVRKDPAVAILSFDGRRESFGTRYTTCINNPTLRSRAFELARRMAERYAANHAVTSWHLDNELGDASLCYCDTCRLRFIEWLKGRYQTPAELNRAWGLAFWSLEIDDWEELWLPARSNHFPHNPALLLDFRRFSSSSTDGFAAEQAKVIRAACPGAVITTNLQSVTRYHTDYFELAKRLDVASTNFYPPESYNTIDLDLVRSVKGSGFWVVEQKSAAPDGKERHEGAVSAHNGYLVPQPGETRLWTYESAAHGADMILYFRWRACPYGAEQFHGGILGYDGAVSRVYREIAEVGGELERLGPALAGTGIQAEVALLYSPDSRWALESFSPHPQLEYRHALLEWHRELEAYHVATDLRPPDAELSQYKLVVAPLLYLMTEEVVRNLLAYVRSGGTLILTARSGAKDEHGTLTPGTLPPDLLEALGATVEESFALAPSARTAIEGADGTRYECTAWVDLLEADGAEALYRYTEGWFAGKAAVVRRRGIGGSGGTIVYVGTVPEELFRRRLLVDALEAVGVSPILEGSRHLHVTRRTGGGRELLFVLNPTTQPGSVLLSDRYRELLSGAAASQRLDLEAWGVAVLEREGT
ncbi:MAG TPA: beta-galactosidase [Spirochaetia bacterium]|nr:beta-galactosidase [Spirochaetia bacterium]